jgi:hypothetical protein
MMNTVKAEVSGRDLVVEYELPNPVTLNVARAVGVGGRNPGRGREWLLHRACRGVTRTDGTVVERNLVRAASALGVERSEPGQQLTAALLGSGEFIRHAALLMPETEGWVTA